MLIKGYELTARLIATIVGGLVIVVLAGLLLRSCEKRRSEAAQARVEHSQAEAASDSAKDAINAVAASGEAEQASEDVTRANDKEIRNAEGANQSVGSGVDLAGRRSLCKRAAYRDDPKCRMFQPTPR